MWWAPPWPLEARHESEEFGEWLADMVPVAPEGDARHMELPVVVAVTRDPGALMESTRQEMLVCGECPAMCAAGECPVAYSGGQCRGMAPAAAKRSSCMAVSVRKG